VARALGSARPGSASPRIASRRFRSDPRSPGPYQSEDSCSDSLAPSHHPSRSPPPCTYLLILSVINLICVRDARGRRSRPASIPVRVVALHGDNSRARTFRSAHHRATELTRRRKRSFVTPRRICRSLAHRGISDTFFFAPIAPRNRPRLGGRGRGGKLLGVNYQGKYIGRRSTIALSIS